MALTEQQKEYQRGYYLRNRDRRLAYLQTWREQNRDKIRDGCRQYQAVHRTEINEMKRRYRAARVEETRAAHRIYAARRRALKAAAVGTFSKEQWASRCDVFGWRCAYCHTSVTAATVQIDHIIPLSRGGTNWPSNLAPSCEYCNKSKGPQTWIPSKWKRKGILV